MTAGALRFLLLGSFLSEANPFRQFSLSTVDLSRALECPIPLYLPSYPARRPGSQQRSALFSRGWYEVGATHRYRSCVVHATMAETFVSVLCWFCVGVHEVFTRGKEGISTCMVRSAMGHAVMSVEYSRSSSAGGDLVLYCRA